MVVLTAAGLVVVGAGAGGFASAVTFVAGAVLGAVVRAGAKGWIVVRGAEVVFVGAAAGIVAGAAGGWTTICCCSGWTGATLAGGTTGEAAGAGAVCVCAGVGATAATVELPDAQPLSSSARAAGTAMTALRAADSGHAVRAGR